MFKITVNLSNSQPLYFTVSEFTREGSHIKFVDKRTDLSKSFPDSICYIEEINEEGGWD